METLKILLGDFRRGRAVVAETGLQLRAQSGAGEFIPFVAISTIKPLRAESLRRPDDQVKKAVIGGVLGGIASGAMAGGLTGPAGAVLGAAAGALLAATREFTTCKITLADDRQFTAIARTPVWLAIADASRRPQLQEIIVPESAPSGGRSGRLLSDMRDRVVAVAGRMPGRKN